MTSIDLSQIIKRNKNKWVALTKDNKFVASGTSLHQVLDLARKRKVQNPSVFKAPDIRNIFLG